MTTRILTLVCLLSLTHSLSHASVAWKPPYGVRGQAIGGATAATCTDAAAALVNPAALVQANGSSAQLAAFAFWRPNEINFTRAADAKSPGGYDKVSTSAMSTMPFAGAVYRPTADRLDDFVLGLSVTVPWADSLVWPEDGPNRYWGTETSFSFVYVTPALAWKVSPKFSVGAGLSHVRFEGTVKQKVDLGAVVGQSENPELDGDAMLTGSGTGWGFNLGTLVSPTPRLDIGLSYLSGVRLTAEGTRDVTIPLELQDSLGLPAEISFVDEKLEVRLPSVWRLGTAYRPIDSLLLAAEIQLIDRSKQKLLLKNHGSTAPDVVADDEEDLVPGFDTAYSYKAGAEYTRGSWSYRLGLVYDQNGVPSASMSPGGLDARKVEFTLGAGKSLKLFTVDVGYSRVIGEDREVRDSQMLSRFSESPANGRYEMSAHVLSLGLSLNF